MSKSGCDYTLGTMEAQCGVSLSKGIVKAYIANVADVTLTWGSTSTTYNVVTGIALAEGAKFTEVSDFRTARYDGSEKANSDGAYEGEFTKTFSFNFKSRSILGAQDVDALTKNPDGWIVIVQYGKDLGSAAFELFGAQTAAKVTATTANLGTTDELENTPTITMSCTESSYGVFFNSAASPATEAEAYAANLAAVAELVNPSEDDGGEG